ncbi:hypothetical protein Bbelb_401140 [Branchiostoma belcheri]|nr:hypothetical protein Bbelb_401140 [Branchiostoma belcheri]
MSAANEIVPTGVRRPMREEDVVRIVSKLGINVCCENGGGYEHGGSPPEADCRIWQKEPNPPPPSNYASAVPKSTVNTSRGKRGRAQSHRACSDADSEGSSDDERCPNRGRQLHKKPLSHRKTSSRETSSPSLVVQHLPTPSPVRREDGGLLLTTREKSAPFAQITQGQLLPVPKMYRKDGGSCTVAGLRPQVFGTDV